MTPSGLVETIEEVLRDETISPYALPYKLEIAVREYLTSDEAVERMKDVLHEWTNICNTADTCAARPLADELIRAALGGDDPPPSPAVTPVKEGGNGWTH